MTKRIDLASAPSRKGTLYPPPYDKPCREHVRQQWHPRAAAQVDARQLTPGRLGERASLDHEIVEDHHFAVCGAVDVELDAVGAALERQQKALHGVLDSLARCTPMSDALHVLEAALGQGIGSRIQIVMGSGEQGV